VNKIITLSLTAILVTLALIVSAPLTSAQTPTTEPAETTTTESDQSTRCNIAQARLNTRITQVDKAKVTQAATYTTLQGKLAKLVASAETSGYDTAELLAAQTAVKAKVEVYTQKATAYANILMSTKNLSCGESSGAFASSLVNARAALTETRTAALDARTTFKEKAIPALKAYATWLQTQTEEEK